MKKEKVYLNSEPIFVRTATGELVINNNRFEDGTDGITIEFISDKESIFNWDEQKRPFTSICIKDNQYDVIGTESIPIDYGENNQQYLKDVMNLKFFGATLLSKKEAKNLLTEEERRYKSWWWLRSPGINSISACFVYIDGYVISGNGVDITYRGVRPALKISNLSETNFKVGDYFNLNGYKFKIISESLAFMIESDIGCHRFDKESNVYERSEVKKFVDEWFQKFIKSKK